MLHANYSFKAVDAKAFWGPYLSVEHLRHVHSVLFQRHLEDKICFWGFWIRVQLMALKDQLQAVYCNGSMLFMSRWGEENNNGPSWDGKAQKRKLTVSKTETTNRSGTSTMCMCRTELKGGMSAEKTDEGWHSGKSGKNAVGVNCSLSGS